MGYAPSARPPSNVSLQLTSARSSEALRLSAYRDAIASNRASRILDRPLAAELGRWIATSIVSALLMDRGDRRAPSALRQSAYHMQHLLHRIPERGRMIFGVAIVALGVEHLVCANMAARPFPAQFHAIVIPVIPWIPAHPWLAYVTGAALLVAGLSILMNVHARAGALLVGGILLGWNLILHVPRMVVVPQNWGLRGEVCEMLALSSAAFILAGTLPRADGSAGRWDRALANIGRVLFGMSAVVFGVDHFLALDLIASLVPAWMPGHIFLASLTGAAMIAAGVSILTKWMGGLGAFGLGMVFLVFVLTLHVPRVLAAPRSPDEWSSALIALGMWGASWICASVAALAQTHPIDA